MAYESARDGSVYDIIYADVQRISSLLAQFSDDGLLVELTRAVETGRALRAGVNVKVVSADTTSSGRETKTEKIDPQWLLPLLFLDEAQHLIERDMSEASMGSLALIQGKLIVNDVRILQKLWSAPAAKKIIVQQIKDAERAKAQAVHAEASDQGNRAARRLANKTSAKTPAESSDAELIIEMLPLLPHSPQVNVVSPDHVAWATINPEYMVGSVEDLMLKHGAKVAGSWSMVGIVDARPFEVRDDEDYDEIISAEEQVRIGMFTDSIWKVATELAFPARQALGRPILSYGMTPLVIFREIERPMPSTRVVES